MAEAFREKEMPYQKQLLNIVQDIFNWKEDKKDNEKKWTIFQIKEFSVVLLKSSK